MHSDPETRAGAILDIDLDAVGANWRALAARVAPARCAGVVKADGYGLGAAEVAGALVAAGCATVFVATLDEGIALRATLGPGPEIAVLNGPLPGSEGDFGESRLVPVLNDPGQVEAWHAVAGPGGPAAILQVDTGMARLGLERRAFEDEAARRRIAWRALMSHLACADTPDHKLNEEQRRRFAAARALLPGVPASLAASSGIFLGRDFHADLVRPGAALYGVNPTPGMPNPMRQVIKLQGKILQVREIDRGHTVGYGAAHVMGRDGRLATVALGYGDGWLRSFGHRGWGRLAGQRVPLVGRVSMDLVTFDVSALPEGVAHAGALVELIGEEYGLDDAASDAGTIGYEILCGLGRRYHRRYRRG